ncbi:zona pellucida protein AX 4 [Etheostoma cragini]|uniref:zona pellucida protein AX 4 n=1 Tax=Etheostoma cragini TaxID=417921 RepID=UPI00155E515C|nr:zona pellucida protein AX 4 [Etheostoma cragini]
MAFGFGLSVILLLSVWTTAKCDHVPNEVLHMECRDRYFMIAVDLFYTGNEPSFEAVDETGVYPITKQYAAKCGYSVSVFPASGHVELRASYFSCHADNKKDEVFTFNFNLIVTHKGKEVTYALNKTCSPSLPWSPREVTCEVNYMEVTVSSDVACPGTKKGDWDAVVKTAYASATADWQVMFQKVQQELLPISLKTAKTHGYAFDLTDGRLVFRTPYGQPESYSNEVNGVPVEVVHATLFSRQSWVLVMVDLVAACSMHKGSYDNSGYIMWETPEVLHPLVSGHNRMQVNIGVNGELVAQPVAEKRGYIVKLQNSTVEISIPYSAEGGYRKSIVSGNLYEFYMFHFYFEQISLDGDHVDTRLRVHRTLATPLVPRPVSTANRTVSEERTFTVYLGDIPEDVALAAVHLNGQEFTVPFTNASRAKITKVVVANHTHGYTLKVPFDDSVVKQRLIKSATIMHMLDINYTLTVLPENEPFYQVTSVMALTNASSPAFDAVCSESGISFKLDHRPIDYLWEICIGSELLTSELAAKHGYIMSNNTQRLLLEVPLFTLGYKYKDITLNGFFGTFELLMRDHQTVEVQNSTVKTCQFSATELIVCSADGRITVLADLPSVITSEGDPARINLVDRNCVPKEMDGTRALFSFPINSCGATVKLGKEYVTYENDIFFSKKSHGQADSSNASHRVTMQCTYPLAGLLRLFLVYRFESDTAGVGRIVHFAHSSEGLRPTIKPTTILQTPLSTQKVSIQPAYAQYLNVSSVPNNISKNIARFSENMASFLKNISSFPNNLFRERCQRPKEYIQFSKQCLK